MFAADPKHQHQLRLSSAIYTYYLYTCIYTVLSMGKYSFRNVSTYFATERVYLHVTFAKRFVITLKCCMIMHCKINDILIGYKLLPARVSTRVSTKRKRKSEYNKYELDITRDKYCITPSIFYARSSVFVVCNVIWM